MSFDSGEDLVRLSQELLAFSQSFQCCRHAPRLSMASQPCSFQAVAMPVQQKITKTRCRLLVIWSAMNPQTQTLGLNDVNLERVGFPCQTLGWASQELVFGAIV